MPYIDYALGRSTFTVDSRYTELRPIGRGAYGLVAAALDTVTNRKVRARATGRADTTRARDPPAPAPPPPPHPFPHR